MSNIYNDLFLEQAYDEGMMKGEEKGLEGQELLDFAEKYANDKFENSGD